MRSLLLCIVLCVLLSVFGTSSAKKKRSSIDDHNAEWQKLGTEAMAAFQSGKNQEAYAAFLKMQGITPNNHELYIAAGQVLQKMGKAEDALQEYLKAIEVLKPGKEDRGPVQGDSKKKMAEPYEKIGELFKSIGDYAQALTAFDTALEKDPTRVSTLLMRGTLAQEHEAYQKAEADFLKASALEPKNINAWNGLGVAWMFLEHACQPGVKMDLNPSGVCKPANSSYDSYDEGSIAALRTVMELEAGNMVTLSNLVMAENRCCDWSRRTKHLDLLRAALFDAASKRQTFAPPFHAFEYEYSPSEMRVNSKYLSQHYEEEARASKKLVPISAAAGHTHVGENAHKLNVGYTNGAGFHNGTTTARCLRSMFSFHDPQRINVLCYALSGNDKSEEREKIKAACAAGWTEGSSVSDLDLAIMVAKDNVHVLVDTTGYTMKYRAGFLALTKAPIVLSFHGFPGTMAAKFVHYLSSDVRTVPPEYQAFYTEKLALVPWTYLVNDHKQSRREVFAEALGGAPTRESLGFAEDDIILASFNQLYKIEPRVFGAWLEILRKQPLAKLWLLNFSKAASKFLRAEAEAAGVRGSRIVFHDKFPKDTELLAKGHADLFLDTPLFNAHTTGGDVLWAGIPVITLPGTNFAQRVASGLVHSATLGNVLIVVASALVHSATVGNVLIARTLDEYVGLVLAMTRRPAQRRQLKQLKERLVAAREAAPLFDTKLLTRHIECTMKMMWEVYAAGSKPRHVISSLHQRT